LKAIIYRLLKTIKKRYYSLIFKPKGYSNTLEHVSEIKTLHKGYSIDNYNDPFYAHLNENLSKEASFEMKEVKIGKIEKGRVLTNLRNAVAVIDNKGLILGTFSFSYEKNINGYYHHANVSENYFLSEKQLDPPLKISGTVFSMLTGGGKKFNFYHWFFDVLARVNDLKQSGWYDEVDYFLIPEYVQPFQKESLKFFGITQDKIISSVQYKHIQADCIVAYSHPRTATYSVRHIHSNGLYKVFSTTSDLKIDFSKFYPKRFFISRKDAPRRKIVNEDQFAQRLLKKEVYTIVISDYTFLECIYLFKNANCIISPHSAALTNILFAQNTTKVIEIFEENAVLPYYYELSKTLELDYTPVILKSKKAIPKSRYQIQSDDIQYDIDLLIQLLNI
jgi:capsular polysaccharide biosynthesis protein